jgi:hypothetical protein
MLKHNKQPFPGGFAGASSSELESSELDSSFCFFGYGVAGSLFNFFCTTGVATVCFGAEIDHTVQSH